MNAYVVLFDIYCDAKDCTASARLKAEPSDQFVAVFCGFEGEGEDRKPKWDCTPQTSIVKALPPGWGCLTFQRPEEEVELDFCAVHLKRAVSPWVARLVAMEADVLLGEPVAQVDLSLVQMREKPQPEVVPEEEGDGDEYPIGDLLASAR